MAELPPLTPIASEPLSVVLLARNQADHLEAVLAAWVTFLNGLDREYEVIVVDDGSADGTAILADKLATSYRRVQVLRHSAPVGEGAALRTALAVARYPLLFYTLCDPHYQPADLGKLLHKRSDPRKADLEVDHVHVLSAARGGQSLPLPWRIPTMLWRICCRVLLGQAPERSPGWLGWKRHLVRMFVRILFGVRYHDVACPFRLQRRAIFARIPLQSDGPFVHVEILAKANYLGLIMGEEVPLERGHYPPPITSQTRKAFHQLLADARRLIFHPSFGPTVLESASPAVEQDPGARETPAPENSGAR